MRGFRRGFGPLLAVALLVTASPATAQDADVTVTHHVIPSFDDTPLEATLLLPAASAQAPGPLVLRTHGWGGTRETQAGTGTLSRLLDQGYAVLTWDQRGFGCSGGEIRINDPDVEGRDVTALLDWAVANAPVAVDDHGDPIVGMSGGSYAGGIQTAGAAVDPRIDALAPEISWSDLGYSLYSGDVVNQGWVAILYSLGVAAGTGQGLDPSCAARPSADALDPAIHQAVTEYVTTGRVSAATEAFLAKPSLASYGAQRPVAVPTLVLQGSVDTLFDLTDGYGIYRHVRQQGVDARFVTFCGGHVACPAGYTDAGDRAYLDDAIVAWFARHLRGEDVATGAPVSYRTNEGVWRDAEVFDGPERVELAGAATGLPVVPVVDLPDPEEILALVAAGPPQGVPALPITSAKVATPGDPRAVTFPVAHAADGPLEVRGIPDVTLTVSGVAVSLDEALAPLGEHAADLPTRAVGDVLVGSLGPLGSVTGGLLGGIGGDGGSLGGVDGTVNVFVKFVHREAGAVLNLQEGAVRVGLTDGEAVAQVPMPGLAYTIPVGDHLDVEVSTASIMHATGRTPALIDVAVSGAVPVAGNAVPVADATPVVSEARGGSDPAGPPGERPCPPPGEEPVLWRCWPCSPRWRFAKGAERAGTTKGISSPRRRPDRRSISTGCSRVRARCTCAHRLPTSTASAPSSADAKRPRRPSLRVLRANQPAARSSAPDRDGRGSDPPTRPAPLVGGHLVGSASSSSALGGR